MVDSFPVSSFRSLALGQQGGGTLAPALSQGYGLIAMDPGDPMPSDPLADSVWWYPSSDPTTLTGQTPGSIIVGIGAAAGQVAFANASGVPVVVVDDGVVVAPITASLILAGNGTVGAPSISFENSATTGFYRSAADTIGIAVAGALDFTIAANTLTAASGSTIATNTIAETTAASGVTIDGVLCKDNSVTVGTAGQIVTDTVAEKTAAAGVTVDGCLIKDGRAAALATASMFTSTEQTGTGSAQTVAHGLGSTPSMYWWTISADASGTFVVASPSADATNVTLTVTTGAKFYVYALK